VLSRSRKIARRPMGLDPPTGAPGSNSSAPRRPRRARSGSAARRLPARSAAAPNRGSSPTGPVSRSPRSGHCSSPTPSARPTSIMVVDGTPARPRSAPVPSRRRHPRWNVDDHPRLTRANPPSGSIPHHPVAGTAVAPPETLCARITAAAPRSTVSRSGPSRRWASSTHPWRAVPRTDGPFPGPSSRERWGSPIRRRWR